MPPSVALSEPFIQASEGQQIDVRCSATGNPLPEFYLTRTDGQLLNPAVSFYNSQLTKKKCQNGNNTAFL